MKLPDRAVLEKVRQWLVYGDEDLRVARDGFSMPEGPPSRLIAFHAQQCAEKHLKAYLVFRGVDFRHSQPETPVGLEYDSWAVRAREAVRRTLREEGLRHFKVSWANDKEDP
jgi:hypothetical protein